MPAYRFTALITFGLLPCAALAQPVDTPADVADTTDGYSITVTGQPVPLSDAVASVAVVTADDLARDQDVAVADALTRLPGVAATRNGAVGGVTSLRIRGADAGQTLVVIDGVKVGDPSAPSGGFDFGSLLTGGIDRIEVLRGSNSVAWGSDAIGGVVVIDTAAPGERMSAAASAEYGTHDTARANARIGQRFGPVSVALGGGYYRSDGISSAAVGSERDAYRQYAANGRVRVDLTSEIAVTGSGYFADSRLELDGFPAPLFSFADTDEYQTSRETYAALALEQGWGRTAAGGLRQRLSYSLADINRDTFDPAAGSDPSFGARGRSERLAYQGEWAADSALRLQFGAERETSRMRTADAFSSDRQRTRSTGFYGQVIAAPAQGVTLSGGVRHDDHRDFGGNTSVSLGAAWLHAPSGVKLRASFAEGYKAPTLFQLSGSAGGFGNPALRPERSRSYDIGVTKALVGHWLTLDASLYRRDSRNLIDFVSCPAGGPIAVADAPAICATGTRPFGTYDNVARARAQGMELDLTLRPLAAPLTLRLGYARTDTRDRSAGLFSSGKRLARRPVDSGIISVDYAAETGALGIDIRYIGDSFDDRGNMVRLDDYTLVTLRGSVALGARAELFGRVENLFDRQYQSVAGYGTYGRTATLGVRGRF